MISTALLSGLLFAAGFKGTWQGPLVRQGRTDTLTLIVDDATAAGVHGRLLVNGDEYAPLSDGSVDADGLTFRADTLQFATVVRDDAVDVTVTVSHGSAFHLTMHRIAALAGAASPRPPQRTVDLVRMRPEEISSVTRSAHAPGTLILAGGGTNVPAINRRFAELANGGPIVLIPTALEDRDLGDERLKFLAKRHGEIFGSSDVVVLHTRARAVADSEDFVKPLLRARGVWIMGGEDEYLLATYQGTRTETEMRNLLSRGGVVGGTSAGAIVQLAAVPTADGHAAVRGFGFLPGVVVWPHWSERHAEAALVNTASQLKLLGIGIDEATAIVVHGDELEVIGEGRVGIADGHVHDGKEYYLLSPGQRFKMTARNR